ncbi:MAG TPA: hypothetical protein VHC73_02975, partial [Vitreimonas sp.]|nr:hypothetical protein [Vitreimonas sp.]
RRLRGPPGNRCKTIRFANAPADISLQTPHEENAHGARRAYSKANYNSGKQRADQGVSVEAKVVALHQRARAKRDYEQERRQRGEDRERPRRQCTGEGDPRTLRRNAPEQAQARFFRRTKESRKHDPSTWGIVVNCA